MAKYLSFFFTKLTLQVTRFLAFNDEERMNSCLKRKLVSQVDEIIELHKAGVRARRCKVDEKQPRYSPFIAKAPFRTAIFVAYGWETVFATSQYIVELKISF